MKSVLGVFGFCLSAAIHGVFFWLLSAPVRAPELAPPVQVEFIEVEKPLVKAVPSQVTGGFGKSKSGVRRNLFPSSSPIITLGAVGESKAFDHDDLTDHHIYGEAQTDVFGENADWSFLKYLHQKIDEQLLFESVLAQWNHFGSVYLEFWIDYQGHLLPQKMRAKAADPILKVHSLRALRRALSEPFSEAKWNQTKQSILVRAKFDYILGDPGRNFEKQKAFSKRYLVFHRSTAEKPVPSNLADHLASGGISIDPFQVYERWQKYNHKKKQVYTEFDPFKSYREDPDYQL